MSERARWELITDRSQVQPLVQEAASIEVIAA